MPDYFVNDFTYIERVNISRYSVIFSDLYDIYDFSSPPKKNKQNRKQEIRLNQKMTSPMYPQLTLRV